MLGLLLAVVGCEGSETADSGNMSADAMMVVARDARGGSMPQDAGAEAVDVALMLDAAGGAGGSGGAGGVDGDNGDGEGDVGWRG